VKIKQKVILILFLFFPVFVYSQDITVFDDFTKWGMPGVKVYVANFSDTLETNSDGEVNIDIMPNNATIVFAFPMFKQIGYTKSELAKLHNVVYMSRSAGLLKQNTSLLATREYSGDLPFFTEIVNLDDASIFETDDVTSNDKLTVRTNQSGFSNFQGLQAGKVLLSMDGIRLNDDIHKNGKVEGLLSFDNTMTQSVRQIYGTGFTIYSPDAIGGVINYFTKTPAMSTDYVLHSNIELNSKYESASNSFINNLNASFATTKFTSYTSFSFGKFGEIKMGKNRKNIPVGDESYGLNLYYVERNSSGDTIVQNTDPYTQKGTDYEQLYFLQKFRFKLNEFLNVLVNFHYVNTSEVGIYSGLTEINYDHLRFAVCEFEPQHKYVGNINLLYERNTPYFDMISVNHSFINYNEYRITRKFQNDVALHQIEDLFVYNFNTDLVKIKNNTRISYGYSYSFNVLKSNAFFENIALDSSWNGMTRYPTNGSKSHTGSGYLNIKWLGNSKLYFNLGIRNDFRYAETDFSNISPQLPLSFTKITKKFYAPVASASVESSPLGWLYLNFAVSASKHLPVIDDYGKIMVKDFVVNIPTDNLKPEKNYTAKLGFTFFVGEDLKIFGSSLATYAQDAIISKDTTLAGNDSIYFGTDRYEVATKVNIPEAYTYGLSCGLNYSHNFKGNDNYSVKINSSVNYIRGYNITENRPLPNISPMFGNASVSFKLKSFTIRFSTLFNGEKPIEELSDVGEDYIEKAASTGFLSWQVYDTKLTYEFKKSIKLSLGVNNIFDRFYIPYGTAIAAPGRNFVFSIKFVLK